MFDKKEDKVELGVQKPPVDLAQAKEVVRVELAGHKLAEEALRATEEQLRFVADHMPVFIACCDDDRRYKLVNQPYAEMFGLRPADIIGKHARDVLGEEAYARASPYMETALAGQPTEHSLVLPATPGGPRTVRASYLPERDGSGRVVAFIAAIVDIAFFKRAEVALRHSQDTLRTVLDSIPAGVFWKDRELNYVGCNRRFLETVGAKSTEEIVGKSDYDLPWEREQADSFRDDDRRVIESGVPKYDIVEPYVQGDGTRAWARTNKLPLRDTEGNVVGVLGIYEDITERKWAEEKMRMFSQEIIAAREEERRQVASVLHHDVGSLAVGVSAHLDALEEELRAGKLEEALKWTKRTRRLFDESVVSLKGVAVRLRPPELDILGLRAALRQHFSQLTKHGDTRIHFRETLGQRQLSGDIATTLFRTAQEALTNAITHGDAKSVDVRLSASKRHIRLTVRDNGKGFTPVEREEEITPRRMGIRVMREMTTGFGGKFEIHSWPGKGTTVRVSLPFGTAALGPGNVRVPKETVARRKTTRSAGRASRPQGKSGA